MFTKPSTFKTKSAYYAAVDVGSTKIACFIAHASPEGELKISGVGHQLSRGIRAGSIIDVTEAQTSIVAAVHAAEQMAGETIENVIVNVAGTALHSRMITVELAVSGEGVSDQDMADIIRDGEALSQTASGEHLHCFPVSYTLDGARGIRDPRQMIGHSLGADLHLVSASQNRLRNLEICINRSHLNVSEFVASAHAAGLGCLAPDEMELGVTMIDMGGGSTSVAVFAGGKNIYMDSIPVGGMHITNDIAHGLSTPLAHAERVKTLHGNVLASAQDERVMIDVPQLGEEDEEDVQMPRSMLASVIRPRVEEIFEMVRGKLHSSGVEQMAGRRMVLTGGASQLTGTKELAAQWFGKQVRIGKPHGRKGLADAVSGPGFTTAMGLLECAVNRAGENALRPRHGAKTPLFSYFSRMFG